jgi:hypothetical protein
MLNFSRNVLKRGTLHFNCTFFKTQLVPCSSTPMSNKRGNVWVTEHWNRHCCEKEVLHISVCWWANTWECACVSLAHPVRKVHTPYRHLWPLWLHHTLWRYLINGTIFGKTSLNTKCVFHFSLQLFITNISHFNNNCVKMSSYKVPVTLVILIKLEFSQKLW